VTEILNQHSNKGQTRGFKMDIEDYFIIALVFAIVAFLCNSYSYGYFFNNFNGGGNVQQTLEQYTFGTELNILIILPSAYVAVAFTIGGFLKALVKNVKIIIRKANQELEEEAKLAVQK
jgi:hypothetical protein